MGARWDVQAMVLAAGLGTRLWPLTEDRAKPALPFLGRPLISHVIELLARHRVTRAVVNTHYRPESIQSALKDEQHDVELRLSHESEILGTAGCLAKALAEGLLEPDRRTLIINAKLFTDLDLGALLDAHRASGARVSMALLPNPGREAFREVEVEQQRVVGFGPGREPIGPSPLLFTGIHVLEPDVLRDIPLRFCDTIRDVYPPLIAQRQVHAHIADGRTTWWEFSTPERYLDLHLLAADRGWTPAVTRAPDAVIEDPSSVHRSVLWEGSHVEPKAVLDEVIVGAHARVPAGLVLERSIVVPDTLTAETRHGRRTAGLLVVPLQDRG